MGKPSAHYAHNHPERGQSAVEGFDCSGFVRVVLSAAGLTIPDYIGLDQVKRPIRHANEFWDYYGISVHADLYQRGDLVFFSRNGIFPTHVGIVQNKENFIHAPGQDNTEVSIETIRKTVIESDGSDHLLYEYNPIGFKSPTIPVKVPTYRYHQRPI